MDMTMFSWEFFMALGSIVILDLVLAGDNAVVIAMAANRLAPALRRKAILIGTAGAVVVRLLMTLAAVWLLTVPFLKALGGCILIPIAIKLLAPAEGAADVRQSDSLMGAVRTILVADAAMGIDNVLAIAGASGGHFLLVFLGLIISIPIVVGGSQIIGRILDRFPVLLYGGAAILGWTSGSMITSDGIVGPYLLTLSGGHAIYGLPLLLALGVCAVGYFRARRPAR